jgi:integrase
MSSKRLTDAIVKRLPAPAKSNKITYDGSDGGLAGFGCRVTAAGAKSFVLNYMAKERRITIGRWPTWTTGAAREEARKLRKIVDRGGDPLADIEAERDAPTVGDLIGRFEGEYLPKRRVGTQRNYASMLNCHVRPHWSPHTKVDAVTTDEIEKLHRKLTAAGSPARANSVVKMLGKMFALAVRWGWRSDNLNPARGVEKNHDAKRKRYLSGDELARLTAALTAHPDQQSANVIRLLLLTGARRGEVLGMRWVDLDLGNGIWLKPATLTKQNRPHEVPLSAPACALLAEIAAQRGEGEFVFPGGDSDTRQTQIQRFWHRLCRDAGLVDCRVHDLRHSFASTLVSSGASLPLIGALLGHSSPTTTARYSHLYPNAQRAAVEHVAAVLTAAGNPEPPTEPTPIASRRR